MRDILLRAEPSLVPTKRFLNGLFAGSAVKVTLDLGSSLKKLSDAGVLVEALDCIQHQWSRVGMVLVRCWLPSGKCWSTSMMVLPPLNRSLLSIDSDLSQ